MVRRALVYFACAFGLGFVLGAIRVPWLVPRVGERAAELIETPIMWAGLFFIARWLIRRYPAPRRLHHLGSGVLALALMIAIEFTVVLWLRGLTLLDYVETRDPIAGWVYVVSLGLFAVLPWVLARSSGRSGSAEA